MNRFNYILKSLIFYRRTHAGVVLGAAISTAILVGALVIGDSVRFSLRQLVFDRLGQTEFALETGDRFFRTQLAVELQQRLDTETAAVLRTRGMAVAGGGEYRVNQLQVFGVDKHFSQMGNVDGLYENLAPNQVIINERLATALNATVGDELLLRFEKLDAMPKDAPLATDSDLFVSQRVSIQAVAGTEDFGRFSLRTNQVEPYTAFVSRTWLAEELELSGKSNMLLVALREEQLTSQNLQDHLDETFALEDASLELNQIDESTVELRSDRIFIDSSTFHLIQQDFDPQPLFTYFVNELRVDNAATPYSFVTAATPPLIPNDLQENEILINRWLADDLNARPGDDLTLTYFVLGNMRRLVEEQHTFRIRNIVPLSGRFADRSLMPDFPGLSDQENCRDWEAGIPIDYDNIRDKDEIYWDDYRGTPKAFIPLKTGQELWGNRFGQLTALRFSTGNIDSMRAEIDNRLDPESFGFVFQPVREQGLQASQQSVDFAQLFIGLSFFLIIAALLLTGLLFVFSVEQRNQETGLLRALGYPRATVRGLLMSEGAVLALVGALLGILLGLLYHQGVLWALKTIWQDIVGTSALQLHVRLATVLMGVFAGFFMSLLSMWLATRRQARRTITDLQKGTAFLPALSQKRPVWSWILGGVAVAVVAVILLATPPGRGKDASTAFFAAGGLLFVAAILFSNIVLVHLGRRNDAAHLSLKQIGRRNNARRRSRSLTLIGVLAAGVFITFTVGANRSSPLQDAEERSSGTGGFSLWAETTLPLLYDLNTETGRDFYNIDSSLQTVEFVPFRVREGDDASCLNLNRISNPQLIAVDPEEMLSRNAFSFVQTSEKVDGDPWSALQTPLGENVFPGIANQTDIVWQLSKEVGDTLTYVDEKGQEFYIKLVAGLANSIFQGNVIVDEELFLQRFPSNSGYKIFLVDQVQNPDAVANELSWALQDQGVVLQSTAVRLAEFNKVTNTYLSIFMILGGLGLVLGSIGIGIVLVRNVMERRGELALMRAVGFGTSSLQRLVLSEHLLLLILGILSGVLAAFFAVLPALNTPGTTVPYAIIFITLALVLASGLLWTWLAARFAMRGDLLSALRNE
mgnify:FL=1